MNKPLDDISEDIVAEERKIQYNQFVKIQERKIESQTPAQSLLQ